LEKWVWGKCCSAEKSARVGHWEGRGRYERKCVGGIELRLWRGALEAKRGKLGKGLVGRAEKVLRWNTGRVVGGWVGFGI
jgi:hypothetical protein